MTTNLPYICILCRTAYQAHVSCLRCGEASFVVHRGERAHAEVDGLPEVTSARALVGMAWRSVSVTAYPTLQLGEGALVGVQGPSGGGKSTWTTRALDTASGPVVLVSAEEPPGPTLVARFVRCSAKRQDFIVIGRASVDQVVSVLNRHQAVALALDSLQVAAWSPRDLRHLIAVVPSLRFVIAVAQQNKAGLISGKNDFIHECDVIVECEELSWRLTKSRYQPTPTEFLPVLDTLISRDSAEAS